jgi:hypothetical protein
VASDTELGLGSAGIWTELLDTKPKRGWTSSETSAQPAKTGGQLINQKELSCDVALSQPTVRRHLNLHFEPGSSTCRYVAF